MPRGLDHIVHAVRDLDAAAERYRELGFTVGARNKHPWGTHNHVVQFPGFFIEILTLAEADKMRADDGFSQEFGVYNRDFAARHEGLSMLVLESNDSDADVAAFRRAGIAASDKMRFEREGKRPDGTPVHVAFSLAFARDKAAEEARFFTCQQHYPENFWNPAFQSHANGATGIGEVVMVANEPSRHREFLLAYTGGQADADGDGFRIALPRGAIGVITPAAFVHRFGVTAPDTSRGARLAALRIRVVDPSVMQAAPELAGLGGLYAGEATVIGGDDAMGAVLVFEPAAPV